MAGLLDDVVETAAGLCEYAPRLWEAEQDAAADLAADLRSHGYEPRIQEYTVEYPRFPVAELTVDGESLPVLPAGLESGTIDQKSVIDAVHVGGEMKQSLATPSITFNPYNSAVSKPSFYHAPALAVARDDVSTVLAADTVNGRLEVEWERFRQRNLLVGSTVQPSRIVLTHIDSWWGGFIDNAFSVAALLHLLPRIDLDDTLVVFAGSEEVCREDVYWCYGYRQFEQAYGDLLDGCDTVTVVDSIGRGDTQVTNDSDIVEEALVLDSDEFMAKAELVAGGYTAAMEVLHSRRDTAAALTHGEHALTTLSDNLEAEREQV